MKITNVRAYARRQFIERPFVWRRGILGSGTVRDHTIMRIETDEGIEGISYMPRGAIAIDIIERHLKSMLIGQDPLLKELMWHRIWELDRTEELPIYMLGAVDIALWDITAKAAKLPLYKILGGNSHKVPAYASTVTYDTVDQYLRVADQCLERGFKAIKLHAWGDVKEDARLAKALRRHVGDDIELMYDGTAGFDLQQSILLGRHLEEAGYLWYEEPMREFNIHNYRRLCEELTIPVLAAETSDGCHYNAADFIIQGACDLIRTSCHQKGGVTGALRIAHLADAFGMKAEIHGSGIDNLHLACAIPNNSYYEVLVYDDPALYAYEVDAEGNIAPPDEPGIGVNYDWELLEKEAILKV